MNEQLHVGIVSKEQGKKAAVQPPQPGLSAPSAPFSSPVEPIVIQFMQMTGFDQATAIQFLTAAGGDLNVAYQCFARQSGMA